MPIVSGTIFFPSVDASTFAAIAPPSQQGGVVLPEAMVMLVQGSSTLTLNLPNLAQGAIIAALGPSYVPTSLVPEITLPAIAPQTIQRPVVSLSSLNFLST